MPPIRALLALCLIIGACTHAVRAQDAWPTPQTEHAWGLAIIDVETTGLDPSQAEMIDIGAIYTDLEGNELGRFFTRMMPPHPDRVDPGAQAVNGYSAKRWRAASAPSEAEAAARFLAFHERASSGRRMIFTAFNAPFDKGFVDAWLKRHGSGYDALYVYMPLDLPSLAWGRGFRAMGARRLATQLGLPPETDDPLQHTGQTGAEFNLMIYRTLLRQAGPDARPDSVRPSQGK
ncbi:MAG: exonuclease domain-containing protein [Pseudoxanthomonas suwonensis]|nr:exonuclease domain-containing protein [Pseudoxanthomonas suwonensis]